MLRDIGRDHLPSALLLIAGGLSVAEFPALVPTLLAGAGAFLALRSYLKGRWQMLPLLVASVVFLLSHLLSPLGTHWSVLAVSFLFVACSALLLLWFPVPRLSLPTGPHLVGQRVVEFANGNWAKRKQQTNEARRLQAYVWYPADAVTTGKTRYYHTASEAAAFSTAMRQLGGLGFLYSHFRLARTNSYTDAPIKDGQFPVVVFNHGGLMWPTQNFGLMEELASRGFLVFSMVHPGETSGCVRADGTVVPVSPDVLKKMSPSEEQLGTYSTFLLEQDCARKRSLLIPLLDQYQDSNVEMVEDWSLDSMALLDWLGNSDSSAALDIGKVAALDKVAAVGMSLGGAVSHRLCNVDGRFAAGINLDGMNWSPTLVDKATETPFLQCYADLTQLRPVLENHCNEVVSKPQMFAVDLLMYNDFFYDLPPRKGMVDGILRVIWRSAGHMGFSDVALAVAGPMRGIADVGKIDGRQFSVLLNRLCRLFLEENLKSRSAGMARLLVTKNPDIMVEQVLAPPES